MQDCPASAIQQMIEDGTKGTGKDYDWMTRETNGIDTTGFSGLIKYYQAQGNEETQSHYIAARVYNCGRQGVDISDLGSNACRSTYVSDIANLLMGWVKP